MATTVYVLCALTSALCAVLLLLVDERVLLGSDLSLLRDLSGFAAVTVLLFGLIWEAR